MPRQNRVTPLGEIVAVPDRGTFTEDRLIDRFHMEDVEAGRRIAVFRLDPVTGEQGAPIATATAGDGGWVDLAEPIIVRAGDGFVAVPGAGSVMRE